MELCPNKKNYFSLFINHLVVKEFCFQNCFTLQENTEVLSRIHNYRSKLPIYYKSMSASCTSALLTGLSHQVTPVSDELLLSMISLCYDNQEIIVLKRLASVTLILYMNAKRKIARLRHFVSVKRMMLGTVVQRRTRYCVVRGSYPTAVAVKIYHRLNFCSPTTFLQSHLGERRILKGNTT